MASPSCKPDCGGETRSGKHKFIVPQGVTEEIIRNAKFRQLKELADKFVPPVNTSTCKDLPEKRERLLCAWRQSESIADEIDTLGDLMDQLKKMDLEMREELSYRFFEKSEQLLKDIGENEPVILEVLEMESTTKDYKNKIKTFCDDLKQQQCRVVVAGQVSAGKSTLLNLFLGDEMLPSHTLSCTATICELMYGEQQHAEVVDKDGKASAIPFEDIKKYIDKEDDRSKRFDHEMIRIYTPVQFLKSGIILVDTPGVGENKIMEEVLTDYVSKNDVFGFIFVIKCDDSGGVLKEFKEMLHRLSEIKDRQGQNKFDPKAVIFVANFWDKVKEADKPEVEKRIKDTLAMNRADKEEPSLKGIDLNRQLFFVNSRFALDTWRVGIISEHYEHLIQGVKRFFPIGHKRKLRLAYMWLENLLLRALHPVVIFIEAGYGTQNFPNIRQKLLSVERSMEQAKLAVDDHYAKARTVLIDLVRGWLTDRGLEVQESCWNMEENFNTTLRNWEHSNQHFKNTGHAMVQHMQDEYSDAYAQLEDVEKDLREMPGEKTSHQHMDIRKKAEQSMNAKDQAHFKVDLAKISKHFRFFCDFSFEQYSTKIVETFMLRFVHSEESDRMIEQLVDEQLQGAKKTVDGAYTNLHSLIQSNRALMETVEKEMRKSSELRDTFTPKANRLNDILENMASFMYRNIHEYEFPQGTLMKRDNSSAQSVVTTVLPMSDSDGSIFSLLQMRQDSAFKLRHLYNMETNFRCISTETLYRTAFWGTAMYKNQPGLVFKGLMVPAREVMIGVKGRTARSRSYVINANVKPFMLAVSSAVEFLHLHPNRLVHMELSVDSVYVEGKEPKLTNIFESMEVEYPSLKERLNVETKAGNYVYMAPETFPENKGTKYSSAADVYALGLMFMELWMQTDLYKEQKRQKLQTFMRSDPETALFNCTCAPSLSKIQLQDRPEELIRKCLKRNPYARPSATEFLKDLKDFSAKTHQFV